MPGPEYPHYFPEDEPDELFGEQSESEQLDAAPIDPTAADEAMYRQLCDEEIGICIVMAASPNQATDMVILEALGFTEEQVQRLVSKGVIEFITSINSLRAWRTLHADRYAELQNKLKSTSQTKLSPQEKNLYSSWAQNERQLRIQEERGGGEYHFTSRTFGALVLRHNPSENPRPRRRSTY